MQSSASPNSFDKKSGSHFSSDSSSYATCKHCGLPISSGHAYELGEDSRWHIDCFQCYKCNKKLSSESDFLVLSTGALVCYDCSDTCTICNCKIDELAILLSNSDEAYCRNCFKCARCDDKITNLRYAKTRKGLYCISCHEKLLEKRKLAKMQQQQQQQQKQNKAPNMQRTYSAADSDVSSDMSFSNNSIHIETSDFAKKAKEKSKRLPSIPSPELRSRKEESLDSSVGPTKKNTTSPASEFFNFKQPPELQQRPRITSSDSSLNLSAHTTAENSPLIPQQGSFALRSRESLLKKHYGDNNNNKEFIFKEDSLPAANTASPPMRSPKRNYTVEEKEDVPNEFTLDNVSFSTQHVGLNDAPTISSKEEESTLIVPKQPVPQRSQPLYHARTLSQQQNDRITNPSLSSPTVLGNMSVKSTPTISQNGFSNSSFSNSKNQNSIKKNSNHSRKLSIDDVLASTLKTNQASPENDAFLNKTPLKNNPVEEENDINSILFHDSSQVNIDQQVFLEDEDIQLALKMRNEVSPQKAGTVFSSNDEFMTASNSRHDINLSFNKSVAEGNDKSFDTPKKLGRSLSLKSPKKLFQNLTKSPNSGFLHKKTDSISTDATSESWRSENFEVPPLPTELLTSKHKQKIDMQTGSTPKHRKNLSGSSISNKMYSANPTMPLSEQTLMDGQQAKFKLNQLLKSAAASASHNNTNDSKRVPSTASNHQRSTSASSALQRSIHSRTASLDYMNAANNNQRNISGNSIANGLGVNVPQSDFESNLGEGFKFGASSTNPNNDVNESMLQLRKLKLEIYNLENTKRILANEVDGLSTQKNKLLIEISDMNNSLKALRANVYTSNINRNSNQSQTSIDDSMIRKESTVSSINSGSSLGNNDPSNSNINTKPRFWKSIFHSTDKSISNNKPIDKSTIKISSSTSQPLLNTMLGSSNSTNLSLGKGSSSEATISISELINIEARYNDIYNEDIDAYSKLTAITADGRAVRDFSLIGFCKIEKHTSIPFIIRFFVDFMESNHSLMKQEGIYRKTASKNLIEQFELLLYNSYTNFIKSGGPLQYSKFFDMISLLVTSEVEGPFFDAHLLCSCFKRFLRRLLVPVIPYTNYFDVINDSSCRIILPKEHDQTLALVINHLKHVAEMEHENKMSKYNLALVFAPSLVRDLNNEREMLDFKQRVKYIEFLLVQA